jgi:hypothetical protein
MLSTARGPQSMQTRERASGGGGSTRGALPNLYWRSVHTDSLRQEERFVALTGEEEVEINGPCSLRCVHGLYSISW